MDPRGYCDCAAKRRKFLRILRVQIDERTKDADQTRHRVDDREAHFTREEMAKE
jgi:alpha-D-ribose 1-methylphosphonate 5-phosphate C-P lyase